MRLATICEDVSSPQVKRWGTVSETTFDIDGQVFIVDVECFNSAVEFLENRMLEPPAEFSKGRVMEAHFRAIDKNKRAIRADPSTASPAFRTVANVIAVEATHYGADWFATVLGMSRDLKIRLTQQRMSLYPKLLRRMGWQVVDPQELFGPLEHPDLYVVAKTK